MRAAVSAMMPVVRDDLQPLPGAAGLAAARREHQGRQDEQSSKSEFWHVKILLPIRQNVKHRSVYGTLPPMPTSTVEDYLKCILLEQQRAPDSLVGMGQIAAALGVTSGHRHGSWSRPWRTAASSPTSPTAACG